MLLAAETSLVFVIVPVALFVAVSAIAFLLLGRVSGESQPRAEARLDELRSPRKRTVETVDGAEDRDKKKAQALTAVLERATSPLGNSVKPKNEKELGKLRERLLHAGYRREAAPVVFKGAQLIFAGVGLFFGGVFGLLTSGLTMALLTKTIIGGGIGYFIPELILSFLIKRRKNSIFLGLPDALDLMVVCVEAGLGLDQAMRKVSEELQKSYPQIADEFVVANAQLQYGRSRSEVLQALGYRSGVDDLKALASILIQADKFGSSIGQALRVQSDSMRTKRRQMAEEKAAKTAVKLIFPLVLFIFPGIFVVLIGPAGIDMYRELLSK
ncbi:Bacterial type II secretion system protein F domain protein [Roseimaritima multifibrata]|uniref:Bacterial type II secretion system protein F domain protein n=1 Tax=Roseimaritima multifibrata TaxID=1930274 RepID=A0A517MH07_9BACT|nr:type II secretion system F family protein [Roseimaritima multifibrata]QDS94173.1 Bacterial type II secretion system protein F domain protein [Roseimaritima multifibrata]